MHKLCCVITGPNYQEAKEQIIQSQGQVDLLEWRPDLLGQLTHEQVTELRSLIRIPLLLTLKVYNEKWISLLNPQWLDLPWDSPVQIESQDLKTIRSFHDYNSTPHDLDNIYHQVKRHHADYYKIATMANSSLDVLRMLAFLKDNADGSLIGICMGDLGAPSRVLGPIYGSSMTYTCCNASSQAAPGQIDLHELLTIYGIRRLNQKTKIFGLIGNPVQYSISHQTHNHYFQQHLLNAIYTKFQVNPVEISNFLEMAKKLNFSGLSVTMPLKETVGPYTKTTTDLPINTLHFQNDQIFGYNTDGIGALKALEKIQRFPKKAIIIGAGGAARAIALQLAKKGVCLAILNRTLEKAVALAKQVNGYAYTLDQFPLAAKEDYDLLINCTPVGMEIEECPIDPTFLLPEKWVMEIITRPKKTKLIQAALSKNCPVIYGEEMFLQQAQKQFEIWFQHE